MQNRRVFLLLCLLAFLNPAWKGYSQDPDGYFAWDISPNSGLPNTPQQPETSAHPGDIIDFVFSSNYDPSFGVNGHTSFTITVPPGTTFLPSDSRYWAPSGTYVPFSSSAESGGAVTISYDGMAAFLGDFVVQVNSAAQIKGLTAIVFNASSEVIVQAPYTEVPLGTYTDTGESSVPIAGLPDSLQLAFTAPAADAFVKPGQTLQYTLQANPSLTADSISLAVTLPTGTYSPVNITNGGTVSGNKIKWPLFTGVSTAQVSFSVTVGSVKQLANLKVLTASASGEAVFPDGTDKSGAVTLKTDIQRPQQVTGHVHDVNLDFPNRIYVQETTPLAGAEVQLLDSNKNIVTTATTTSAGSYRLDVADPGTYTVLVRKLADQAIGSGPTSQVVKATRYVAQSQQVTVVAGQQEPVVQDFLLPLSLVNRAAQLFNGLNHLNVLFTFILNTQLGFSYDTSAAEESLEAVISNAPVYVPATKAGGSDYWSAVVRMVATMEVLQNRFAGGMATPTSTPKTGVVPESQIAIKTIALFATVELIRSMFGSVNLPLETVVLKAVKISTMTLLVGDLLPAIVQIANSTFGLQLNDMSRAEVSDMLAKMVRYVFDVFIPTDLAGDLTFEAAFLEARGALTGVVTEVYILATQGILDDAANNVYAGVSVGPINAALSYMESLNAKAGDRDALILAQSGGILKLLSNIRGLDGVLFQVKALQAATAAGQTLVNGTARAAADKALGGWVPIVKVFTYGSYAAAAGMPAVGIILNGVDASSAEQAAFHGVPSAAAEEPALAAWLPGDSTLAPSVATTNSAVSDFLAVLASIQKRVTANDVTGYRALQQSFLDADNALSNYFDPLALDAENANPQSKIASLRVTDGFSNLDTQVAQTLANLAIELEIWADDPTEAQYRNTALLQISAASNLVSSAGKFAAQAEAQLAGASIPAELVITDEGAPAGLAAGAAVTVTVSVTNYGAAASAAGTVQFIPGASATLGSGGTASVTLPALQPGASMDFNWPVQIAASVPGNLVHYQVLTNDGTQDTALQDFLYFVQ